MKLTSKSFVQNGNIPSAYTCDGANKSPELEISEVPPEARSLVILMDDPDVPKSLRPDGMFDHWVMYDIETTTKVIPEGQFSGTEGQNSAGRIGYTGPCPPDKEHRYFFKLYAIDIKLGLPEGKTKTEIEKAIEGHVLSSAELIGRYNRPRGR